MTSSIERANEEYQEYRTLAVSDRLWIAALLDLKKTSGTDQRIYSERVRYWAQHFTGTIVDHMFLDSAGRFCAYWSTKFVPKSHDPVSNFGANVVGPMVEIGAQSNWLGYVQRYAPFAFFMERLFGGSCRPFIPSAYMACRLHPTAGSSENITKDFDDAEYAFSQQYSDYECVFEPKQSDWQ